MAGTQEAGRRSGAGVDPQGSARAVVGVVVALALVGSLCALLVSDQRDPGRPVDWYEPLWDSSRPTYSAACEPGVCVADLVALPSGQPVEVAVDVQMPETLGALSVERIWTGRRGGLFGVGWETVWDVHLVAGRLTGPLPAPPVDPPMAGREVRLADDSRLHLDKSGRVDEVCLDGTKCVRAERSGDSIVLRGGGPDAVSVEMELADGRVLRAATSGRAATYRYDGDGGLISVGAHGGKTTYRYDGEGRLTAIDDGVPRSFRYSGGRVAETVDRDGGSWRLAGTAQRTVVTAPDDTARSYEFSAGLLVGVTDDERGVLMRREVRGGVVRVEDRPADGIRTERLGDGRMLVAQQREGAPPRTATFTLDGLGRVVRTEAIDGTTTVRYVGSSARPLQVSHNGAETTYEYDRDGLLVATVDPDGYRVEMDRDREGLPRRISDGVVALDLDHDGAGRVVSERSDGEEATVRYRPDGLPEEITDRAGKSLPVRYDDSGRLVELGAREDGDLTYDSAGRLTPGSAERVGIGTAGNASEVRVESTKALAGGAVEYRYAGGGRAVFDADGRLTSVSHGEQRTDRQLDTAGRITRLRLPGGQVFDATYTPGGRLASISDGSVTAELEWHGDLLTKAETSEGSTYTYSYDEAGNLESARLGATRWTYDHDPTGLLTSVRGPTGQITYAWDDHGRPTRRSDGAVVEGYRWSGEDFDLRDLRRNGEAVTSLRRDDKGRVVSANTLDGETSFGYDSDGRIETYSRPGEPEVVVGYDKAGQVAKLEYGDRTERWTWKGSAVREVRVEGDDEAYRFDWSAPGLVERVQHGDEQLVAAAADARGRVTKVVGRDDDPLAALSWGKAGLASIESGDHEIKVQHDAEHRLAGLEVDDATASWDYEGGVLVRTSVEDDRTSFAYGDGHLETSRYGSGPDAPTITWDSSGGRPARVKTTNGTASFDYEDGRLVEVRHDGTDDLVEYEDGDASAEGVGGELLGDLFDEQGRFSAAAGSAQDSPSAPWFEHLPSEFGFALPDVVTGDEIAASAIAEALPVVPSPLVSDEDSLAQQMADGILALASSASLPVGPDRFVDAQLGEGAAAIEDLVSADVSRVVAHTVSGRLAPGPCNLCRVVGFGRELVGGLAAGGHAVLAFLTESPVGLALMDVAFLAVRAGTVVLCGTNPVCAVGVPVGLFVAGALIDGHDQGVVAALTGAATGWVRDLRGLSSGDPVAILNTAVLIGSLLASGPAALSVAARRPRVGRILEASVCKNRRVVCVSISRRGEAARHVADAQRNGQPSFLKLDRPGVEARRSSALRGVDRVKGMDRDEYPPAVVTRRRPPSIRPIDPASNRSLGRYLRDEVGPLPDGARFFVLPVA